jgi:hypothetical protein
MILAAIAPFKTKILTIVAIIAVMGVGYWYVSSLKNKIKTLEEINHNQKLVIKTQSDTIKDITQKIAVTQEHMLKLNERYQESENRLKQRIKQISSKEFDESIKKDRTQAETGANQMFKELFEELSNITTQNRKQPK